MANQSLQEHQSGSERRPSGQGLRPCEWSKASRVQGPRRAPPQTHGPTGDQECPYVFVTTSVVPGSGAAGHSASGPFGRPRWPGPQAPWCLRPQGPWGPLGPYVHHPQWMADPEKHVQNHRTISETAATRVASKSQERAFRGEHKRKGPDQVPSFHSWRPDSGYILTLCSWHRIEPSEARRRALPWSKGAKQESWTSKQQPWSKVLL